MEHDTVKTIIALDERIQTATAQFHNSAVAVKIYDPILGHIFGELEFNVADLLFVAILSGVHTIATGPSGTGKTELIRLVCQGVFGENGWFLQKLNPHLNEEVFANIDMQKLAKSNLHQAIAPAPFLDYPATILDEINRAPAALTNILLGFCDGQIQLKCGIKYDVGYCNGNTKNHRYHLVFGTMNEGTEYSGSFDLDQALARRFTLYIPFSELQATPYDRPDIIDQRKGHAEMISFDSAIDRVIMVNQAILQIPLDALAFTYLLYLGSVGSCPHSRNGCHREIGNQEQCIKQECRIVKVNNGFCPSVSRFSEGLLIFLKRAALGMAALRSARIVQAIKMACRVENGLHINKLREFAGVEFHGDKLYHAVVKLYLAQISGSVQDIMAMVPFVGLGGKVRIAKEYITKHFAGSEWYALQNYAQATYRNMEMFFREHRSLFQELDNGNGTTDVIRQRLKHAERFTDPVIRHVVEPLLFRYQRCVKSPEQVATDIENTKIVKEITRKLVC